jgi:hypothetical protein
MGEIHTDYSTYYIATLTTLTTLALLSPLACHDILAAFV